MESNPELLICKGCKMCVCVRILHNCQVPRFVIILTKLFGLFKGSLFSMKVMVIVSVTFTDTIFSDLGIWIVRIWTNSWNFISIWCDILTYRIRFGCFRILRKFAARWVQEFLELKKKKCLRYLIPNHKEKLVVSRHEKFAKCLSTPCINRRSV